MKVTWLIERGGAFMVIDAKYARAVAVHQMILHFSQMIATLFNVEFENAQAVTGRKLYFGLPDYRLPVVVIR